MASLVLCAAAAPDPAPPVSVRPACALTFDDGPGRYTPELLDLLEARAIKATFFVLGERVLREPEVVRRMAADGHEVDNHSFDHPDLRRLTPAAQAREIESTQQALRGLGVEPHFFRPPYGAYDAATVRDAARDGLAIVLWTTDAKDWKYHTLYAYEADVDRRLPRHIGGIYLFHDIHPWTVQAMPEVLDRLAAGGCRFVTVAQYLAERPPPKPG